MPVGRLELPLAVSVGDPAGIGPEIIGKAWEARHAAGLAPFFAIGDIASFAPDGRLRLIEVKTTNGWERTPFQISRNELAVAEERRAEWSLFRLWNFACEPKAFELNPPLDAHVSLTATSFQATFH